MEIIKKDNTLTIKKITLSQLNSLEFDSNITRLIIFKLNIDTPIINLSPFYQYIKIIKYKFDSMFDMNELNEKRFRLMQDEDIPHRKILLPMYAYVDKYDFALIKAFFERKLPFNCNMEYLLLSEMIEINNAIKQNKPIMIK